MTHSYDAFNQWITRTVDTDGDGGSDPIERTAFVHDAGQIVLQFDDTGTAALDAADLSHRYLWGPAVDQLLADEAVDSVSSAGETLWPLADHLGTIRDIVDDNATLRKHIEYDSFGNITGETYYDQTGTLINSPDTHAEAIDQLFAFTGRPLDESTSLQNNLHRWYDAAIGKWISEDWIWDDVNRYRYVGNKSTAYVDFNGLQEAVPVQTWWFSASGNPLPSDSGIGPEDVKPGDALVILYDDGTTSSFGRGINVEAIEFEARLRTGWRPGGSSDTDLDKLQLGLDALGLYPALGNICDVTNGIISISRGHWFDAGLSFLAAIPILGQVVGGAKGVRHLDAVTDAVDAVSDAASVARPIGQGLLGGPVITGKLSREASDAYREAAREIWENTTGRRAIWDGLQIHHRVPLEWCHQFPYADPNRLANLIGVDSRTHTLISNAWAEWKRSLNGRTPTQKEIIQQALRIDEQFRDTLVFPK